MRPQKRGDCNRHEALFFGKVTKTADSGGVQLPKNAPNPLTKRPPRCCCLALAPPSKSGTVGGAKPCTCKQTSYSRGFRIVAGEMGQRVSGCFGHDLHVCGERVRGEHYILVADPYAKPELYSPGARNAKNRSGHSHHKTEAWLRTVAQYRTSEESSTASTEVHSSPTSSCRIVAPETPSSHAGVVLDWNLADVPCSASFPGTTEQSSQ